MPYLCLDAISVPNGREVLEVLNGMKVKNHLGASLGKGSKQSARSLQPRKFSMALPQSKSAEPFALRDAQMLNVGCRWTLEISFSPSLTPVAYSTNIDVDCQVASTHTCT